MTASNFTTALNFIWNPQRDGSANDSAPGETWVTSWGCTAMTWNNAIAQGVVKGTLAKATQKQISAVYRVLFWNALRGDSMASGLDVLLFEEGCLAGIGTVARMVQRLVHVTADGVIGPRSLAAIGKCNPHELIDQQGAVFLAYLKCLGNWGTFHNGWSRREREAVALAHNLAGAPF